MSETNRIPNGPKGKWLPTLAIVKDPRRAFEKWKATYGDPFLVNALNGPIVVTGRPDLIREVFGADPSTFDTFATETITPVLGAGSMILMSGDTHKRERKLVMPMFHGERMRAYGNTMQEVALESVRANEGGTPFDTLPMMTEISLNIIVQTVFGSASSRVLQLRKLGLELVKKSNPLIFFSKKTHFRFLGISPWDRFLKAKAELYAGLDREIDAARDRNFDSDDILSMMGRAKYEDGTSITQANIRDELMTFLFAGHETSALAMTWAIYHLHRYPEQLDRLRNEVDSLPEGDPAGLVGLPFLKAVVQETLRIHPIVTEVLRLLAKPFQLGEYHLPAGMAIAPSAVMAHYDPTIYKDPDKFDPQRFIDRSYSPFEYMPFGGGHRRCIGAAFASYEMAIVIGTLIRKFEFELLEKGPVHSARRSVTLGPSKKIKVRIVRRRNE